MEGVAKKKESLSRIEGKLLKRQGKEWNAIVDGLFHQIRSSMVSIGGYAWILSDQYSHKMDRKMKYYMRRIMKNLEKADHGLKVLQECLNSKGGK